MTISSGRWSAPSPMARTWEVEALKRTGQTEFKLSSATTLMLTRVATAENDVCPDAKRPGSLWFGVARATVQPVVVGLFYHLVQSEAAASIKSNTIDTGRLGRSRPLSGFKRWLRRKFYAQRRGASLSSRSSRRRSSTLCWKQATNTRPIAVPTSART